jgi:hypothetical protein
MTAKLAVARMIRGQPRFFDGRYCIVESGLSLLTPVTTGAPDKARAYDDRVVAQLIVDFLNVLDGIHSGERTQPWIVMPLPEAWSS